MSPFTFLIGVSIGLFSIGAITVIARKNILVVLMGLELMLNGCVLSFINFASKMGDAGGHIFSLIIFVVAATEVAVGIGILILLYREKGSLILSDYRHLKG